MSDFATVMFPDTFPPKGTTMVSAGEIDPADAALPLQDAPQAHDAGDSLPEPARVDEKPPSAAVAVPANIRELREADPLRVMYSPQNDFSLAAADLDEALAPVPGLTLDHKSAAVAEFREIFADFGLSEPEAREIIALARGVEREPPTPEQSAQWQHDTMQRLRERYGQQAATSLDLARKLTARDPRVWAIIDRSRLGDHPEMVLRLCDLAQREALKGRL